MLNKVANNTVIIVKEKDQEEVQKELFKQNIFWFSGSREVIIHYGCNSFFVENNAFCYCDNKLYLNNFLKENKNYKVIKFKEQLELF